MSEQIKQKFLVVVDPSQDEPLALNRALYGYKCAEAEGNSGSASLHVLLAVDSDNTDTSADNPAVHRDQDWFIERVRGPLIDSGVEHSLELSWSSDWYGSIINASKKIAPDLIMLPMVSRPSESMRIFNESIWRLLRTAGCPVLIAQPGSREDRNTILAAVNFQSHKPEYQRLNDLIISRGQWATDIFSSNLHVVNAYKDSLNYPDRAQLANKTKVDTANIHVKAGDPDVVIAEMAKEISADLVLLGIQKRSNRWRGNTASKIITKVDCDILIIN